MKAQDPRYWRMSFEPGLASVMFADVAEAMGMPGLHRQRHDDENIDAVLCRRGSAGPGQDQ